MNVAQKSLELTGIFEAEVLVELMLRFWQHPFAADRDFRNDLLERTAEVLRTALAGTRIVQDIQPQNTNFIVAVWYSEWAAIQDVLDGVRQEREAWLERVKRALPSCFCDPGDLLP
ncbi:MAG: hypothetical protein HKL96_00475 [Phycisphaerales bacterium]|nr:hypothetical protein [Phycisphaerales bacterium]